MALWQITRYRADIDTELQLRRAVTLLQVRYGRRWRRRAPADLVWSLPTGVDADGVFERVRALVGVEDCTEPVETGTSHGRAAPPKFGASEAQPTRVPASVSSGAGTDDPPSYADEVDDRLDEALQLNRQHWMEAGRPISAETLRQRLHISASASRDLTQAVRATDRAAILAGYPRT